MAENKKIGMAINYDYPDYGGMLQAYASFRKIRDWGFAPEVINIHALSKDIRRRKLLYFAKKMGDISIVREKSRIVFKKLRTRTHPAFQTCMRQRTEAFDTFCRQHFHVSEEYASWEALSEGCRHYAAVVVGSDQLWLPSNIAGDYYTLSFVPDGVKKIAYATSFGVARLPAEQVQKARLFLNRIEFLSAREHTGQAIIEQCTGRRVPLVCDPAMLLTREEWNEEASERKISAPYIFCYFMGDHPWQRDFVRKLKAKTGCKIVALLHLDQYIASDERYADETPYDVSPSDFVSLVKHASFVCTDSFHGTVFSMLYGREFFTFRRFSDKATLSTNSRIDTLLQQTGLEDRLVAEADEIHLERTIDDASVQETIGRLREESMQYLWNALNG